MGGGWEGNQMPPYTDGGGPSDTKIFGGDSNTYAPAGPKIIGGDPNTWGHTGTTYTGSNGVGTAGHKKHGNKKFEKHTRIRQ